MDSYGAGSGAGLGISFEPAIVQHHHEPDVYQYGHSARQQLYVDPRRDVPRHLRHLQPLRNAVSHDAGLRDRYHHHAAVRDSRKHVRIDDGTPEVLNGKGGYLPYDRNHLSPLSDFDLSAPSDSASGSSRPFSPASLSSLPSSTGSGAYPSYDAPRHEPRAAYPIQHREQAAYPISHRDRAAPSDQRPTHGEETSKPSRLPAFLVERRQLARPHSMVELRPQPLASPIEQPHQAHQMAVSPLYEVHLSSPVDDVPTSAAALQRERFEASQSDLPEAGARSAMRQSEGRPRKRRTSDVEEPSPIRNRSRSLSAQELRVLAEREAARITAGAEVEEDSLRANYPTQPTVSDEREPETVIDVATPLDDREPPLKRQPTLLTAGASTVRRRTELDRLLMPSSGKFGAFGEATASSSRRADPSVAPAPSSPAVLEQAKHSGSARVELDLMLETPFVVEGGLLKGKLEIRVRRPRDREGELWIGKPKVRIVGFEELSSGEGRYIFFHHADTIQSFELPSGQHCPLPCFESPPDAEDFSRAKLGQHTVPVKMLVPVGKGAKGPWKGKSGVVRYIAIVSIKLKSSTGSDRSIAHFYRHLEVYPYLNPALTLAPAVRPLLSEASKGLFMGGSGQVTIRASIHRRVWIAGQRCYAEVLVENGSSKRIKTLTLSLVRTTAVFRTAGNSGEGKHAQATKKKVAESTLELGKKSSSGATAKGTWLGVDAGASANFSPTLVIPTEELSICRGRHIEVAYALRITASASLSADVSVELPLDIVNFVSLDPPPGHVGPSPIPADTRRPVARSWSSADLRETAQGSKARVGPPRMASMDSLRLEDLEGMQPTSCQKAPALSRVASLESVQTADLARNEEPAAHLESPRRIEHIEDTSCRRREDEDVERPHRLVQHPDRVVVERARERQLRHQMSLQCISGAIASATARRYSPSVMSDYSPTPPDVADTAAYTLPPIQLYPGADGLGIQLDDLEDSDDLSGGVTSPVIPFEAGAAGLADDVELAVLMQSRFSDDEDCGDFKIAPRAAAGRLLSPTRAIEVRVTPPTPSRPFTPTSNGRHSSPSKPLAVPRGKSPGTTVATSVGRPSSPTKRTPQTPEKFAFATPASPVKVTLEPAASTASPVRTAQPATRASRPLPVPPPSSSASPKKSQSTTPIAAPVLRKVASGTSLKRSPGIVRKTSSIQSLRSTSGTSPSFSDSSRSLARSPSLASPQMSPVLASGTNAAATFSIAARPTLSPTLEEYVAAPHRVVNVSSSPALRAPRSMLELRPQQGSVSPRKSTVLPSVKVKAAALESRQAALTRLATQTGAPSYRARVKDSAALSRADSITSSIAPSEFNLKRADSMASFKAPLLRRGFEELPPPVPVLPRTRA